ncbi:hypothetical protein MalM25_24190 [Planctomycetes bacterium MalM25]|nr:hypothetical protein MalM25_24190 [Planctomycetes bacterium MalM25]
MTPRPPSHAEHLPRPLSLRLPRRQALTPEEQAHRRVRRRLLRYILETHRRRETQRGRGLGEPTPLADA